jgi:hypothetical protein
VGGPAEQKVNTVFIPPGEGRQTFSPLPLAWEVENLEIGADGILESIVGPSILRIDRQVFRTGDEFESDELADIVDSEFGATELPSTGFKSGDPFSVFSARILNGSANLLLFRIGSRLYSFNGHRRNGDQVLVSGLTSSTTTKTLDQFVVINDRVVYFNGIDHPRVITHDGHVTPLGYDKRATVPAISSPGQPSYEDTPNYYPNSSGYSWQGRIGTPGDLLTGQQAAVLEGAWYYYLQYEDIYGNLSEFSLPSDAATIHTNQADPLLPVALDKRVNPVDGKIDVVDLMFQGTQTNVYSVPSGAELNDLTRRFLVRSSGDAPEHTAAIWVYRTRDTRHKDPTPRFVGRVPGSKQFVYDDNNSDVELGRVWEETVSVPVFRVACAHQGRLVIANVLGDPGIVRRSQPGFPGTFPASEYIYPDSGGDEITALASHNGNLIAFTSQSAYLIGDDFMSPQPLSKGIGCTAPKSIQAMRDGSLIWLGSDGFYALRLNGAVERISAPIDKMFELELNRSQFFRAASVVDRKTGEYRCAVTLKGKSRNTLVLCYDGQFWRRQTFGIEIADMCSLMDYTGATVFVGSDIREKIGTFEGGVTTPQGDKESFFETIVSSRLFVMGRQSTDYFAPPRKIKYRSAWLRSAEFGLIPTNVRNLYVGMLDSWVGSATIRLYRNGSWDPIVTMEDVLLCGPDDGSGIISDVASAAIIGEAKTRHPRVFWRQIPVDIQNANCWAFEIEILGSVNPVVPDAVISTEFKAWKELFREESLARKEVDKRLANPDSWELGRMKLAAFAFDVSVATKGSPMGRVPYRQDK